MTMLLLSARRLRPSWLHTRPSIYASAARSYTSGARDDDAKRTKAREFTLLPTGLVTFHKATGHFLVPFHFPIPANDEAESSKTTATARMMKRVLGDNHNVEWPQEVRGMNLGRVLHSFMTNTTHHVRYPLVVMALRDIGFPVDVDWRQYVWRKLTIAPLKAYANIEGDTMVPIEFIIPCGDERWPRQTWGCRLGSRVHRLRRTVESLEPHEIEDLKQLDFSFDVVETTWSEKVLPGLETFAQVYGHCDVKSTFVVPSEAPWPRKAWGFRLGSAVCSLRSKEGYQKQVARDAEHLERINFVWNHREEVWTNIILPALETYHKVHGHTLVERNFVVPSEVPWPRRAWGFSLGFAVNHIRSANAYATEVARDMDRLKAVNFVWGLREYKWRERIVPALEVFAEVYGHCRVPRDFVVPSEDPWPEEAWGLPLGYIANDIRYSGTYAKFIEEDKDHLRIIGFL